MKFVQANGSDFSVYGVPIFFRGIGVGSWLNLEHYELGVPGWETQIFQAFHGIVPDFDEQFRSHFFTLKDARYLRSLGINLIRVPINHHLFWDEQQDIFRESGLTWLKQLSEICNETGLYYLPDLHTAPGGQNPDWHSECRTGSPEFWHYSVFRKQTTAIWQKIAELLWDDPMLLGYDLLNEPMMMAGTTDLLNLFYQDTINAIRKVDQNHLIFLEGNHFAMDYRGIRLPDDPQTAFTFHFYPSVWNPDVMTMDEASREDALTLSLENILNSMTGARRPILCGETGFERNPEDPESWERISAQVLNTLEAHKAGWCLWNFKDTGTIGLLSPKSSTIWMYLARQIGKSWNHHHAERIGYQLAEKAGQLSGYTLTKQEVYQLQFMIRAGIAKSDVCHLLIPDLSGIPKEKAEQLAESFAFKNCDIYQPMENLLKRFCLGEGRESCL